MRIPTFDGPPRGSAPSAARKEVKTPPRVNLQVAQVVQVPIQRDDNPRPAPSLSGRVQQLLISVTCTILMTLASVINFLLKKLNPDFNPKPILKDAQTETEPVKDESKEQKKLDILPTPGVIVQTPPLAELTPDKNKKPGEKEEVQAKVQVEPIAQKREEAGFQNIQGVNTNESADSLLRMVPKITIEEIRKQLDLMVKVWNFNLFDPADKLMYKEDYYFSESFFPIAQSAKKRLLEQLNLQIMQFVIKEKEKEMDPAFSKFLKKFIGLHDDIPVPYMSEKSIDKSFQLEEGCYYEFKSGSFFEEALKKIEPPTSPYFGSLIRYKDGQISIYLDGVTDGPFAIMVNEIGYNTKDGRKLEKPSIILKTGDKVYFRGNFLFTVSTEGKLIVPVKVQILSEANADEQSVIFLEAMKGVNNAVESPLTSHYRVAVLQDPIVDTFHYYQEPIKEGDDFIVYVDKNKDLFLNQMLNYFKLEFEVMKYTPVQKMARLGMFSGYILCNYKNKGPGNFSYYFSELLKSRTGAYFDQAVFIKYFADHLEMRCALLGGTLKYDQKDMTHAWNIFEIEGKRCLLDSRSFTLFSLDALPGMLKDQKIKLLELYGLKGLVDIKDETEDWKFEIVDMPSQ